MRTIILLLMVLISSSLFAGNKLSKLRERPVILIQCPPRDEKMDGAKELNQLARSFENSIANQIRNEFPCANVQTYIGIQEAMDRDRIQYNTNELNRVPFNFGHFQDLGSLFNCDVLIVLKAVKYGDKYGFLATTMDPRTGTLAGSNESHGNKDGDDMGELARSIIKDLVEREICPYKGDITFSSVQTYNDSEERLGLPNQDCEFKAIKKEDNKTEQTWTFKKTKRYEGTADVNYTINNFKEESEQDNCHHCNKMENGYKLDVFEPNRANMKESIVITETYSANQTAIVEGTRLTGTNALIVIHFDTKANNYTITVKAATEPAKWTKKTVNTNSGCPYDKNFENEIGATYAQSFNRTFGPYPGSPYQKNLKQTVTKTIIDPDSKGKGKTVETISFNLTR